MSYWQNTYSIGEYLICKRDLYLSNGCTICFYKNKKYKVIGVFSRGIELESETLSVHQISENWSQYFKKEKIKKTNIFNNKRIIEI